MEIQRMRRENRRKENGEKRKCIKKKYFPSCVWMKKKWVERKIFMKKHKHKYVMFVLKNMFIYVKSVGHTCNFVMSPSPFSYCIRIFSMAFTIIIFLSCFISYPNKRKWYYFFTQFFSLIFFPSIFYQFKQCVNEID